MKKLTLFLAATALTATPAFAYTIPMFSIDSATAAENSGVITFTIHKLSTSRRISTLQFTTTDGSAHAGSDYIAKSVNVVFSAAQTTATVAVTLINDSNAEGTETFGVSIHGGQNARVAVGSATGTITDSDTIPAPVATQVCWDGSIIPATSSCPSVPPPPPPPPPSPPPAFSVHDITVNESAGTATIQVLKTGANGSSSTLTYATSNGSAFAGSDYTSTSGTLTVPAGVTISTITVPIINNVTTEPTETFNLTITPVTNSSASKAVGVVTILDSVPAPAPTITGLAPITSEFDYNLAIQLMNGTGAIPPTAAPDVVGAFRFVCGAGQLRYDDPIVKPGTPGASHLHQFYGNITADANSTYASLRAAGTSTCNNGTYAANRSAYWMPAMFDGKGNVVNPDYVTVYYKRRKISDPKCSLTSGDPQAQGNCVDLPNGLRFVFGWDPTGINSAPTGSGFFDCYGPSATGGPYSTITAVASKCPAGVGNRMGFRIEAPDCWDGKNLDSPDHRSHMAYASYGTWGYLKCPADHPYVVPTFTLASWYSVNTGDDLTLWDFSSASMDPCSSSRHGCTMHSDYFEAWDPTVKAMWHGGCINNLLNCSAGDMGNGKQLKGAGQPSYGLTNPTHLTVIPAMP